MDDVAVIDDPAAAEASLDPVRARLLAALAEPGSATTLAARTGLARQKINYHLRALERHGLVELVEERRRGNCTERVLRATAASYVISPAALPAAGPGSAVRVVAAHPGRPAGPGGGRADHPVTGGGAAGGHVRDRQRDPVRFRGGPGRVRPRAQRHGQGPGRPVSPPERGGRPGPPPGDRTSPEHHPRPGHLTPAPTRINKHDPTSRHYPRGRSTSWRVSSR